jgi:VanZ family protein
LQKCKGFFFICFIELSAMRLSTWARAAFWIAAATMLVFSLLPPSNIPSGLHFWDKAQHALGFAVLGIFGIVAAFPLRLLYPGLLAWGAAIEGLQALTTWRHADISDWLADAIGIVLAHGIYTLWKYKRK